MEKKIEIYEVKLLIRLIKINYWWFLIIIYVSYIRMYRLLEEEMEMKYF